MVNEQSFSLQPFELVYPLDVKITGNIARDRNRLALNYTLLGDLSALAIPSLADFPLRKNELWQETCFEFFLGLHNLPGYWEFNLSPAGYWNVYRFADYREGMQEETAISSLPFDTRLQSDAFFLSLELDLEPLIPAEQALEVAIASVIRAKTGEISYWALTHCGQQADFHRRNSFTIVHNGK